jgi:hypothetical protein
MMLLTGDRFRRIGEAMYGPRWIPIMADMFDRDDRMIRYYCGERPVPAHLVEKLIADAECRIQALQRILDELRTA